MALAIVELRRKLFLQARIASYMDVSRATVSRVLRRAGLSRLSDLRDQGQRRGVPQGRRGYFASLGMPIERVLTDNGMSFRSELFGATCLQLGTAQKFTRAYRPQTTRH